MTTLQVFFMQFLKCLNLNGKVKPRQIQKY